MAQTELFEELSKNIQQAEHALLDGIKSTLDVQDESIESTLDVQDESEKYRIRSYILLAHAEFEYYIEKTALDILEKKCTSLANNENETIFLTMFAHWYYTKKFITYGEKQRNDHIKYIKNSSNKNEAFLNDAKRAYKDFINSNNGIRSSEELFLPLGIQLDAVLIGNMDSFGADRGDFAHKSHSAVTKYISVDNAKEMVNNILKGLKEFDTTIYSPSTTNLTITV